MRETILFLRGGIVLGICATLLAQCSTPYQRNGMRGGFSEERLRYNEFSVYVNINGYTSWDTMVDYTLLRASELSLENGFEYFMLLNSKDRSTFTRARYDSIRKPDTDKGWLRPIVRMFRKEPVFGKDFYYNAREEHAAITRKLGLSDIAERKFPHGIQAADPVDLGAQIYFYNENLAIIPKTEKRSVSYHGMDENLADRGVVVGAYLDAERPFADLNKFKELLGKNLEEPKVNAIKIIEGVNFQLAPHLTAYYRYNVANQFIAQFYSKPAYYLGLKFEPSNLADHQLVIRGFYELSAEKQLRIGDKILKINGIDVLMFQKMVQDWFSWKKNAQIQLEISRGGSVLKITVPVFDNL